MVRCTALYEPSGSVARCPAASASRPALNGGAIEVSLPNAGLLAHDVHAGGHHGRELFVGRPLPEPDVVVDADGFE